VTGRETRRLETGDIGQETRNKAIRQGTENGRERDTPQNRDVRQGTYES
jgi:hypothetical protein